jgi:2-polyprenyl-3-methyl-5-hydroxy-6-metoxy-1,4-benzoquinol methylase
VEYAKQSELEMASLKTAEAQMARRGKIAEALISKERPELIDLLSTYQNEAVAARRLLNRSLIELDIGAEILEVGGGILALSIQLASEGFKVTTVEPIGEGFAGISFIADIYAQIAREENSTFKLIQTPIEECEFDHRFDFIFSINVMEHLKDPYSVLLQLVLVLKQGGVYRFFCPNYDFPYEPHFGKWMFRRKNRAFYLPPLRAKSKRISVSEWQGVYGSLNFITYKKLLFFFSQSNIRYEVNTNALRELAHRSEFDKELQNRHKLLSYVVKFLFKSRLIRVINLLPSRNWPIIDLQIFH